MEKMNVLIVGSGGREHALAWKVAQSSHLRKLYCTPGNPGMRQFGECLGIPVSNLPEIVEAAKKLAIDMVIVGPEVPLAEGLVDQLDAQGICGFGPYQSAARIESSKVFAKRFLTRYQIPTARFAEFNDYDAAVAHLRIVEYPVVIKASGLAAGKGVILPDDFTQGEAALYSMMVENVFGSAGAEVIIEERLVGEEVSLMAFSDGKTVRPMPPAQDHKRIFEGDRGPNTGGMGAYAPAPVCPVELSMQITREILQPTVDGLREEGIPFIGVLYAGLMLTSNGPKVLEFNCRFGDPETQTVLPLLKTDLLEIVQACIRGSLDQVAIEWNDAAAACVVIASEGYPGKIQIGKPIYGLDKIRDTSLVFHSGTAIREGRLVSDGGRVLGVTGVGDSLAEALRRAYDGVNRIMFTGMQFRKDIGWRALRQETEGEYSVYSRSGVSIDAGNKAVELMAAAVRNTYTPSVLAGIGSFGGLFDAAFLQDMKHPVLVASTDGVGTKVKLAAQASSYQSVGVDLVNHCINDILVQGARPLFFLDYFASSKINPEVVAEAVTGVAEACKAAGCAILGGETAEMPGVYRQGEFDLAGTIVGVVEREHILPRLDIGAGDVLIGLASSGPHTNGYSLIRKVFEDVPLDTIYPELGKPLGEVLLTPHRSYLDMIFPWLAMESSPIKALIHLTGGGFIENIPRVIPKMLDAVIDTCSWDVPSIFSLIQKLGGISQVEMYRVFNMGIGMVLILAEDSASKFIGKFPSDAYVIGRLELGKGKVILR